MKRKGFICKTAKTTLILLSVFVMLCLFGCGSRTVAEPKEGEVLVYYINFATSELEPYVYSPLAVEKEERVKELFDVLKMTPSEKGWRHAIPSEIIIEEITLGNNGLLTIAFSESYSRLEKKSEILLRASVVRTLCQLDFVDYVEFVVGEQTLILPNGKPAGLMQADDFIDNTGNSSNFVQTSDISVYFTDSTGKRLEHAEYIIYNDGTKSLEQMSIERILEGPLESESRLYPVVNEMTVLKSVTTVDSVCYVDFGGAFMTRRNEVDDEAALYAIVNSLCEIEGVTSVVISFEGVPIEAYGEAKAGGMLERNSGLIRGEMAGIN